MTLNIDTVNTVIDAIEAETAAFNMGDWATDKDLPTGNVCGFTACIAGHAILADDVNRGINPKDAVKALRHASVPGIIAKSNELFGFGGGDEHSPLYYDGSWPQHYQQMSVDIGEAKAAIALLADMKINGVIVGSLDEEGKQRGGEDDGPLILGLTFRDVNWWRQYSTSE